jgi:acylphosphatase
MSFVHVHAYVTGLVQGVFFRASTRERAKELGLGGWVRNLSDGRVEVLAEGNQAEVEQLVQWLWEGPSGAEVENVEVDSSRIPSVEFEDFQIR